MLNSQLLKIYHGNACSTELYVFVAGFHNIGYRIQVLSDELA